MYIRSRSSYGNWVIRFNAIFNNMSVISQWSVLLHVEEIGVTKKKNRSAASL